MKCSDKGTSYKTMYAADFSLKAVLGSAMVVLMQRPSLIVFMMMLMYPGPATAGLEKRCNLEDRLEGPAAGGLCGDRIREVIKLRCMFHRPRRADTTTVTSKALESSKDFSEVQLDKSKALTYLLKRNVGNQGITCECCYNTCTTSELLQYC